MYVDRLVRSASSVQWVSGAGHIEPLVHAVAPLHLPLVSVVRQVVLRPRHQLHRAAVRPQHVHKAANILCRFILLINSVPIYNFYHLFIQVTPRQRQEIYSLNRIMTRLENDRFKKFCQEKGFKGDLQIEDYDIFMWKMIALKCVRNN